MRGHIGAYTVQEETTLKGHKDIFLLRRLGRYIKPHSGLLWIAALFLGVSLVLDLIRPLILKYVIDTALPSKEIGAVLEMAGAYFGIPPGTMPFAITRSSEPGRRRISCGPMPFEANSPTRL